MTQKFERGVKFLPRAAAVLAAAFALAAAPQASAQELTHRFINPSFGGNPFNSDHLRGIAALDRPASPELARTAGLSEQQLLVRQIQSRLLSSLSSGLIEAITGASPGTSGEFIIGDQRITYERTLTEIRLTFFNETTGETTEIVLPVINADPTSTTSSTSLAELAPESVLGGLVYSPGATAGGSAGSAGGSLEYNGPLENTGPVEPPLGSPNF